MKLHWDVLCGLLIMASSWPPAQAGEPSASSDKTEARLERMLKRRPDDPAARYNLGTIRYHKADYNGAADSLNKALASSGTWLQGRASYNLGNAHYRQGSAKAARAPSEGLAFYRQALEDYRLVIRQDPRDRDAQYNYELVERRMRALKEAQAQHAQQSASEQQEHAQPSNAPSSQGQSSQQQVAAQAQSSASEQAGQEPGAPQGASAEERQGGEHAASAEPPRAGEERAPSQPPPQAQAEVQGQRAEPSGDAQPELSEAKASAPADGKDVSREQALWILDTVKREEQGALADHERGPARESPVERDW